MSALWLNTETSYWNDDALKLLACAKHEGFAETIPELAAKATAALAPIDRASLINRLTLLGMSMANGKDREQIEAWLNETVRLLEQEKLAASALLPAIDECVKEPGRVFIPSVGEICARAKPAFRKLHQQATRLNILRQMLENGVPLPEYVPPPEDAWNPKPKEKPWFPKEGETAKILAEVRASLAGKLQPKTPQEMAAEGREMPRPSSPSPVWDGLT